MGIGPVPSGSDLKEKLLDFTDGITNALRDRLTSRQTERTLEDLVGEWGFHVACVQIFPESGHHVVALGIVKNDGDAGIVYRWEVADSLSGWKEENVC